MGDLPSRDRDACSASIAWTSAVLESFGRGLICLDAEFNILNASPLAVRLLGHEFEGGDEPAISELLGDLLFGPVGVLRTQLTSGERRARWTGRLSHDPSASVLTISAAALDDAQHDTGVSYAVLVGVAGDDERWNVRVAVDLDAAELHVRGRSAGREELRAVLDHYHWQRAEAARALGISRTTLWRKMREVGLI